MSTVIFGLIGVAGIAMIIANKKTSDNFALYGVGIAFIVGGFGGGARLHMYETLWLDIVIGVIFGLVLLIWVVVLWIIPLIKKAKEEKRIEIAIEKADVTRTFIKELDKIPNPKEGTRCFVMEDCFTYIYKENAKTWVLELW